MTTTETIKFKPKTSTSWRTLLDLVYPVGSYYFSTNPVDPASIFGGVWAPVSNRFLYAVDPLNSTAIWDPKDNSDSLGGSNNAIVPYHNHTMSKNPVYSYSISGTSHGHSLDILLEEHSHTMHHQHYTADVGSGDYGYVPAGLSKWKWAEGKLSSGKGKLFPYADGESSAASNLLKNTTQTVVNDLTPGPKVTGTTPISILRAIAVENNLPNIKITGSLKETGEVGYRGESITSANMPAYQKVYCWWRRE